MQPSQPCPHLNDATNRIGEELLHAEIPFRRFRRMGNHRRRNVDSLAEPRTHGFREYVNSSEMRQTFPPGGQSEHRLRSGIIIMPARNSRPLPHDCPPLPSITQYSPPRTP